MKEEKLLVLPTIFDAGGDLKKSWYIEFTMKNPRSGKLERQRLKKGIN